MSTSRIPQIPRRPQKTLSYQELQAENARLRSELREAKDSQGGVKLSSVENRLDVSNIETPDISVDKLSIESKAVDKVGRAISSASLFQSKGKLPMESLKDLTQEPIRVEAMRVRVPDDTVNRMANANGNKNLKGLEVEFGDNGQFNIKGKVNQLIDVPFELNGFIDNTEEGQIRVRLGKSKLFGLITVPKLLQDMASSMAGKKLDKLGVKSTDEGLVLETASLIPKNVDFKVSQVTTKNGELVVEGGPASPQVITMGPWGPIPPKNSSSEMK